MCTELRVRNSESSSATYLSSPREQTRRFPLQRKWRQEFSHWMSAVNPQPLIGSCLTLSWLPLCSCRENSSYFCWTINTESFLLYHTNRHFAYQQHCCSELEYRWSHNECYYSQKRKLHIKELKGFMNIFQRYWNKKFWHKNTCGFLHRFRKYFKGANSFPVLWNKRAVSICCVRLRQKKHLMKQKSKKKKRGERNVEKLLCFNHKKARILQCSPGTWGLCSAVLGLNTIDHMKWLSDKNNLLINYKNLCHQISIFKGKKGSGTHNELWPQH